MTDAQTYLADLARSASRPDESFIYTNIEVHDRVAGKMAADPRIEIVNVEKGEFGLDWGTMVLDFKLVP